MTTLLNVTSEKDDKFKSTINYDFYICPRHPGIDVILELKKISTEFNMTVEDEKKRVAVMLHSPLSLL